MKKIILLLVLLTFGCHSDDVQWSSTDCCRGHGKTTICYRAVGATHGHIMCEDGYTSGCECY